MDLGEYISFTDNTLDLKAQSHYKKSLANSVPRLSVVEFQKCNYM